MFLADSRGDLGPEDVAPFLPMKDVTLHLIQQSTVCAVPLLLPVGDPSVLKDVQLGTTVVLLSIAVYCLSSFIDTFRRLGTQEIACKQR